MAIVIFGLFDARPKRQLTMAAVAAKVKAMDDTAKDIVGYHIKAENEIRKPLTKRTADRLEAFTRVYGVVLLREAIEANPDCANTFSGTQSVGLITKPSTSC